MRLSLTARIVCSGWLVTSYVSLAAELPQTGDVVSQPVVLTHGQPGFTRLAPERTGMTFRNALPLERHLTNQILPNGSGVAAGDIDGDGLTDLFFSGLASASRLYQNRGDFKFEDVTAQAGVVCANIDATGAALADLDGDRALDLIVNSVGAGTRIFWNDGKGRFTVAPEILNPARGGMSLALADIDGDGRLDLYIANYRAETIKDAPGTRFSIKMVDNKPVVTAVNGRPISHPALRDRFNFSFSLAAGRGKFSHEENGEPDVIYRNEGNRRFKDIPFTSGAFLDEAGTPLTKPPLDWGLSVMLRDLNDDGAPDIYVCNDFASPDRLWINDGAGRFRAISPLSVRHTSLSSMAVDFADINRDGHVDFFVADMLSPDHRRRMTQRTIARPADGANQESIESRPQYPRNTLFLNRGDGTFAECAEYSGVEASDWSWSSIFLDVDFDGYEDLLIANGFVRDNTNIDVLQQIERSKAEQKLSPLEELRLRKLFPELHTANVLFKNLGNLRFKEMGKEWGFSDTDISQGMCLADLDNDGDMDLAVNNMNASAGVYRNNTSAGRIGVRLKGLPPNSHGIGAKISVFGTAMPQQSQEMIAGGRYLSSDEPMRSFAVGAATNQLRIEVEWRSGRKSVVENVTANRIYQIDEASAQPSKRKTRPHVTPLFEDVSKLLGHTHGVQPSNDFDQQPTLQHKVNVAGPGVTWHDLDEDGWDDLLIGASRGGSPQVYLNNKAGGFTKSAKFGEIAERDQTSILAWESKSGANLLTAFSNYRSGKSAGPGVRSYTWRNDSRTDEIPAELWSYSPMAMADFDGDGDLDLFLGGRVLPGRYPESVSSRIYAREDQGYRLFQELPKVGLVSGAIWSDVVGDRSLELLLACEWGPIRVFKYEGGRFTEITDGLGLSKYIGKWNAVATGDFDSDGRLDIIASNWGSNSDYQRYRDRHLRIYFGQIEQRQAFLESAYDPALRKQVPITSLEWASKSLPDLFERFGTTAAYANAGIDEVLGRHKAEWVEANWFESTVFLNRGGSFKAVILPPEAQFAPAYSICVGDCDGDGHEDIFLGQNFFGVTFERARSDSGRGLWIRGDGTGFFEALPGEKSGVTMYGEQRGAALCDYDRDGRIDLAVAQIGAETKLYRNVSAKRGLRATLKSETPAIGALLRARYKSRIGPARELHLGSGYLSQDSSTMIFGNADDIKGVIVRWPDGKEIEYGLPENARAVELDFGGQVRVTK